MGRFDSILRALNDSGARYVVVGGLAVVLQGHARLTVDIDVVLDLDSKDTRGVIDALLEIGLRPSVPVNAHDFLDTETRAKWIAEKGMRVLSLSDPDDPFRRVDLFVEEPIEFEDLWSRSQVAPLEGFSVRIASIPDLLAMKREAGRPKDLEDIEVLELLLRSRHEGETGAE